MQVYVNKAGQQFGPYTVEEIRRYVKAGNFDTADYACCDGANWVRIAQIPGFAEAAQPAAAEPLTPARRDKAVLVHAIEQQLPPAGASSPHSKKRMIILWTGIGGVATLLVSGLLIWILGGDEGVPESNQSLGNPPDTKAAQVSKIDLDDPETLDGILAEAIDEDTLLKIGEEGAELAYAPSQETPYTGWAKSRHVKANLSQYKDGKLDGVLTSWHGNGQRRAEAHYKEGKVHGLWIRWYPNGQKMLKMSFKNGKENGLVTSWYENGQKECEGNAKDGKRDGLETWWYENGQKQEESNWRDDKLMSAEVWKPNGEKSPVTNVKNGNGVVVEYNKDGTEDDRSLFKDGEVVRD